MDVVKFSKETYPRVNTFNMIRILKGTAEAAKTLASIQKQIDELSNAAGDIEDFIYEYYYIICELLDVQEEEEEEQNKNKECYVYYILNRERDRVKIGVSNDPVRRAKLLQWACADEVEIAHTVEFANRKDAYRAESFLHKRFSFWRKKPSKVSTSNEWFDAVILDKLRNSYWTKDQIQKEAQDDLEETLKEYKKLRLKMEAST